MFDLEKRIGEWRAELSCAGIKDRKVLAELEGHLRLEFARQREEGGNDGEAFALAVESLGEPEPLRREFNKVRLTMWNRKIAYVVWGVYAVSFFLPAYDEQPGWWCAILQGFFWKDAVAGNWACIQYELLTLANMLMLVSPIVLFGFGNRVGVMKWFRPLSVAAVVLVWAFIGLLLTNQNNRQLLRIGCPLWGLSFVGLSLSMMVRRAPKPMLVA